MNAARLREAATLLRERAEQSACPCGGPACTTDNWFREGELLTRLYGSEYAIPLILTMAPTVALAFADWLDAEAARETPTWHLAVTFGGEPMFSLAPEALAVADAILGATS